MRRWLNFGVQDWEFYYDECFSKGVSSDDGWLDIVFTAVVFVKESVLGGDLYFGGCCPQGCYLGCLFLGVPPIYSASCL